MTSIEVLRIKLSTPHAHFRIIHSNHPCKTYPVPPYSTIIGFLANLLGDMELIQKMLTGSLGLGVLSRHAYISNEYTWLRNLSATEHRRRFHAVSNRNWQEIAEHPGGQSPVKIEVLNEVETLIYIFHSDDFILQCLEHNAFLPEKWFSHLHLGRAEDWTIIESVCKVNLRTSREAAAFKGSGYYYQWMSAFEFSFGVEQEQYKELYEKLQFPAFLITSRYKLVDMPLGEGSIRGIRNFDYIPVRLFRGSIPFLSNFKLPAILTDKELEVPVFLALV